MIATQQDKSNLKLIFPSNGPFNDSIRLEFGREEIAGLISRLERHCARAIKKETKAYTEEISIYKNDVERSLFLSGDKGNLRLSLICYTDKPQDDNWINLSPAKLAYFVGLLYGYL